MDGQPQSLPYPPLHLANRVGALKGGDPFAMYELIGRRGSEDLRAVLPADWSWERCRVLDFGCGAGRTLRHFLDEAARCEFYGCDTDVESIDWLQRNLCPPFRCFVNGELPPLPFPPASLDIVWAVSVFTHLTESWSKWLLEVHRVLRPEGLAVLTFMGCRMSQLIAGEPLDEDEVGMLVLRAGAPWDEGGPMVLHSPWWIREHWGRAFDVLSITPDGFASQPGVGQGIAVLRKRVVVLQESDLERPAEGDFRELAALRTNVRLLNEESRRARQGVNWREGSESS